MLEISEKPKMVESALLVSAYQEKEEQDEAKSLLKELGELVDTLGVPVKGEMLVHVRAYHARLLVGTGKAEEIITLAKSLGCDVIVFDNELSPAQQRNWEKEAGLAVIDRQEVILDIFGKRARTREARLQVDLARMEYSLPRLTRAWGHLGKMGGGIGGKGEGETQLEVDRRLTRRQIDKLREELVEVKSQRATQRKERQRVPVPCLAIVGYTNAGKSSLLRTLTDAEVLVEDKLFATLDTTTRKLILPSRQAVLLTDTVGFVRKLPHRLVESFNATLEESLVSDFLIHLLDGSDPEVLSYHDTTLKVLAELGAEQKQMVTVFNKIDRIEDPSDIQALKLRFPEALFLSAKTGEGVETLLHRMDELISDRAERMELKVPLEQQDWVARLYRETSVLSCEYLDSHVAVTALVPKRLCASFKSFTVSAPQPG
ncbi:MAG: GTPase HflX [Blastochloris sp.]|nr:GTPase HflX [Blastochloris sp.]